MVQVLDAAPKRKNTTNQLLSGAFGGLSATNNILKEVQQKKMEEQQLDEENQAAQREGMNLKGFRDPKLRHELLQQRSMENREQKLQDLKNQELNSQRTQKNKDLLDKLSRNKQQLSSIENQYELEPGTLSSFEDNPQLAASTFKPKAESKTPRPRLEEQPIDPAQKEALNKARNSPGFDELDEVGQYRKMVDSGVSPKLAETESKLTSSQIERKEKTKQESRKEEIGFHKETEEYDKEVQKHAKTAKNQLGSIKTIEKKIASGKVSPSSAANLAKYFGHIGERLSSAFLTGDEAAIQASIPGLLEGWKEVFGVRLSDADLRVLQDKLPDISKSPEANRAVLKVIKKYANASVLRGQISNDIKKNNKELRPLGYQRKVEERFDEMMMPVKMLSPKGKVIEIPAYQVGSAIQDGGKIYQEENIENE